MSVDVDAVNERLNGLVTLLQAVGVESGDVLGKGVPVPDARQLNDDQIEAIIRKLQQAQSEAPQIIAALEAHAEARSLGGNSRNSREKAHRRTVQPPPQPEPEEESSEEDDDDENYPMVGHGVSDDISVVSDLTTPTVMVGNNVPEEEQYLDTLPPMIVGGGGRAPPMMIGQPKRKNLVNQVRPGVAGPPRRNAPAPRPGGAAATRRKVHNHVVSKLGPDQQQQRPKPRPKNAPPPDKKVKKKKPARRSSSVRSRDSAGSQGSGDKFAELSQRKSRTAAATFAQEGQNWNAFESQKPQPRAAKPPTVIDNDGFLVGGAFDPFGASNNNSFSAAGDLANAASAPRGGLSGPSHDTGTARRPRPSKKADPTSMQSNFSQQPLRGKPQGAASGGRPRRARRASLAM